MAENSSRARAKILTREKMLAQASLMFDTEGYAAVTMRRLAGEMGMTTGALFGHFTGKDEIYRIVYGHDPITPEHGRAMMAELAALRAI